MKRPKTHNYPKHLNRPPNNPNSLHNRISVAISTANRHREVPVVTLNAPPWEKEPKK